MAKKVKEKFHRLELLVAISLVIVLIGIFSIRQIDFSKISGFSLPLITGFVASDILTQNISLEIDQSQTYKLSAEDSFTLTSLKLGGSVEGQGLVQIFLEDNNGKQLLIYSNIKEKQRHANLITGRATANIALTPDEIITTPDIKITEDQEFASETFYSECVETCFIALPFSPDITHKLVFYIGKDTKLKINQVIYTIK